MKNTWTLLLILLFVSALFSPAQAQNKGISGSAGSAGTISKSTDWKKVLSKNDHSPNLITVKLDPRLKASAGPEGINDPDIQKLLDRLGVIKVKRRFQLSEKDLQTINSRAMNKNPSAPEIPDLTLVFQFTLRDGAPNRLIEAIDALNQSKYFQYVTPETYETPFFTPNDSLSRGTWWIEKIQASKAWDITKGDTNIVVGIVDTGFDLDHPDLKNQIKYNYADPINGLDDDKDGYIDNFTGWDFVGASKENPTPDNDPSVKEGSNSHGTLMSGCACAETDNVLGTSSPGFKTKFLPVKTNADNSAALTAAYDGILYAAQKGCKVINCSFGSDVSNPANQELLNFVTGTYKCLIVAAAGNSGTDDLYYPAQYRNVLSVAGTDFEDKIGVNSTFGIYTDLSAPAKALFTSDYNDSYTYLRDAFTSVACAVVSGSAGLVASRFPTYTGMQLGELLRVTSDPIDSLNPGYEGRMGKGRINLFRALSENPPAIRMQSYTYTDGNNNVAEPGEKINLQIVLTNYLATVSNLQVSLSAENSPFITVLNPTIIQSSLNTLETKALSQSFEVQFAANLPENYEILFRMDYRSAGYRDYEYFSITVNNTFRNLTVNRLSTTLNHTGNFGYNDYPDNKQGLGLTYQSGTSLLFEGGLILSASTDKLSDNVRRNKGSFQNRDFQNTEKIILTVPGTVSDAEITTGFADTNTAQVGVQVSEKAFAFKNSPDDQYIILEYRIKNVSGQNRKDFFAGLFADWDIVDSEKNTASFDVARKLAFCFKDDQYAGVVSLNDEVPVYINNYSNEGSNILFTPQFKRKSISSDTSQVVISDKEVVQFTGAGPYNIADGETIKTAFALVAGKSLIELQQTTDRVRLQYRTLNADTCALTSVTNISNILCAGESKGSIRIQPAGGTSPYQYTLNGGAWGDNPAFTGLKAGTYELKVRDAKGCEKSESVTLSEPKPLRFKLLTKRNSTCPACTDGVVVAQASGGVPPYEISIGNKRFTGNVLKKLIKGSYTVQIKDANGCTVTRPTEVK